MSENERAARNRKITKIIMWIVLLILFIMIVFPFIMVVINVFKTKADINSHPLALIGKHGFTTKNFPKAMKKMHFWRVFGNSLIITLSSTVLTLLLSAMCAFVLVRNKWKACTLLFTMMIASMVIPFQVLMVPLVSFYGGAALIDGCTRWQTFWKVVYPLLTPTTATVAIIDAMAFWNDYLLPSLVLTDKSLYTIPIATQVFYGTFSTDIGLILAALLMAMLPILILYVFLQKYIVAGVTSGAVKG